MTVEEKKLTEENQTTPKEQKEITSAAGTQTPEPPTPPAAVTSTGEPKEFGQQLSTLDDAALQAAAHAEEEARKKIIETGKVEAPKKETEPPVPSEKLFGEKFKTTDELVLGVMNAGRALKYAGKFLELDPLEAINEAKKSGDWKNVEEIYKQLDTAIAQAASQPSGGSEGTKPETDKSEIPNMDAQQQKRMMHVVLQSTRDDVFSLPVMSDLRAQGIEVPEEFLLDEKVSREFMAELRQKDPVSYFDLKTQVPEIYNRRVKEAQDVLRAHAESAPHNTRQQATEATKIKDYAKAIGLPLKDEELAAWLAKQMETSAHFESRYGSRFLRAGSLADAWYLQNREKIAEQIRLNAERTGREQAVKDINGNGNKQVSSISTTNLPADQTSRRAKTEKLDLRDDNVLASLSDEELQALNANEEKRNALMPG